MTKLMKKILNRLFRQAKPIEALKTELGQAEVLVPHLRTLQLFCFILSTLTPKLIFTKFKSLILHACIQSSSVFYLTLRFLTNDIQFPAVTTFSKHIFAKKMIISSSLFSQKMFSWRRHYLHFHRECWTSCASCARRASSGCSSLDDSR